MEQTAERLRDKVAYWKQQSAQLERERSWLAKGSLGAAVLSAVGGGFHWQIAAWGLSLTLVVYIIAMYMTWVRRGEFREYAQEAAAELLRLSDTPPSQPSHSG
jgi:hypothetical protein